MQGPRLYLAFVQVAVPSPCRQQRSSYDFGAAESESAEKGLITLPGYTRMTMKETAVEKELK